MGPLEGVKVVELAGLGPCPHAAMLLADMGANVMRVDRKENVGKRGGLPDRFVTVNRNRPNVAIDLRSPEGLAAAHRLCDDADILIEGYRPGVLERLGLGPDVLLARNPRLVIGRATGWGQDGPLSKIAGHDINYISVTGALSCIGPTDGPPVPPLNLVGDLGGGSTYLVMGVLAAHIHASRTGKGQVVDAAMIDGTASLMAAMMGRIAAGGWDEARRGVNFIDGGAHFYGVYETSDGKYVSIGSIEPQFYDLLLKGLGLDEGDLFPQNDKNHWPENRERLAMIFKTKTQDEWVQLMQQTDACFAPILTASDAPAHPHNDARGTYVKIDGFMQPAPAPRFSETPGEIRHGAAGPGQNTRSALIDWGFAAADVARLEAIGAVEQATNSPR
jgi:alpha-methylacyl-CoA racemase